MSEDFDIGPLTWVQDEINQSLDAVLENCASLQSNILDTSQMRFSQTHLYQASGALDMVGLEGCKLFCSELEKLASKLEKKQIEATPEMVEAFIKAVKTLKYYIQELLNGAPDIPLRLYSVLNPIVQAQGETLDESELFFPDTTNSAPKDVPSKEFSEADYAAYIVEQRLQYQKSLLSWLQTKQPSAVESMSEAVSNVSYAQHKSSVKTLWWAASAFTETLELPAIADNAAAKKLCRRLDQELKQLSVGVDKPHNNLLRDILYFVAISEIDKATVLKVKQVFELDALVDKKSTVRVQKTSAADANELSAVEQLKTELESLREVWDEVSNSIDFNQFDASADDALVGLDNVLITKFADKSAISQELAQKLSQPAVKSLFNALHNASSVLRDDKTKANHTALIEIATALHLLDSALSHYQQLDEGSIQSLLSEIKRLESVATGEMYDAEVDHTGELDRDTLIAVVKDIHATLKVVEQALDTFFRNPSEKSSLALAPKPIKQVAAIFDMLSLSVPMQIVNASGSFIQYFQQDSYIVKQYDFELVAESLSMIGLYADEMPRVRPESEQALEGALQRLNSALEGAGVQAAEAEKHQVAIEVEVAGSDKIVEKVTQTIAVKAADTGEKICDTAFDSELLDIYLTEAEEVLAHIAQNLQALRVNETALEPLVEVRRSFHTLKGSGRTVGLNALGEVAAHVETYLNGVLDKKTHLNTTQISRIEEVTAQFAAWAAELRANNEVHVAQTHWLEKVAELSQSAEKVSEKTTKIDTKKEEKVEKTVPQVLIGGTRKMARAFYDIFMNESMQNLTILEQDVAKIADKVVEKPTKAAQKAVHTLASNALAAEFSAMGDLCRALEYWLDEANQTWSAQHLDLYTSAVKNIARMWQKISEQKNPRAATALIKVINEATEQAKQRKELNLDFEKMSQAEQEMAAEVNNGVTQVKAELGTKAFKLETTNVDQDLLNMFIEEAHEIMPEIGTELRAWRNSPKAKVHAESLQRSLHTLKGSARMAGQLALGNVAHGFEEQVVRALKSTPSADDFENMFVDLDKIANYFDSSTDAAQEEIVDSINNDDAQPAGRSKDRKAQFLRMRADTLDRLINEAGEISIIRSRMDRELVGFKQSSHDLTDSLVRLRGYLRELEIEAETQMQSRMTILQEANETFDPLEFDRFTRLQELTRMIAESVNDVATIQNGLLANLNQTEAALQQQNRMNRDLQQSLLGVRMLPFKQISDRMQRIVRQTARELKKSVDLVIDGETTEIDRSVLDKLGAPLEHLLRNAVAHGIELPGERKMHDKPEIGTIRLVVKQSNDEIHLTISDDGAGVNLQKVKEKATKAKLLNLDAEVTEQALLAVIFEPGFSTSDKVSQIAGRGVGLDVVRNDISGLGGRVDLTSEYSKGAVFNIHLPVTQSVAQALLVRAGNDTYALPVAMIEQAQKIKRAELVAAYAAGEINWAGTKYPLHHLAKLLDHQDHQIEDGLYASVLLMRSGAYTVALHIDEVIGNQEVVMKPIGTQLARVPGIVGATVAGDGSIVLIINPVQIANREILSAGNVSVKSVKRAAKVVEKMRAMVVDDSLTMRKVLGRLLERDGYDVLVAKDGMDAIQMLQESTPDIILTDIEMPRMDGFGFARNVRDDARTKHTPLIMISSRTADKHRSLAKEIGVDAFFGKPVQDDDLLETMKALLQNKK